MPGTYVCTPKADKKCATSTTTTGDTALGGTAMDGTNWVIGTGNAEWMFKADDPDAKLIETADGGFMTYGWWLKKSRDGKTWEASSFYGPRGDSQSENVTTLGGKATYTGGATGLYALSSSTGGENDSGQFTADVTLTADFSDRDTDNLVYGTIDGTIDNFKVMELEGGTNSQERNWSVKLQKTTIGSTGNFSANIVNKDAPSRTIWTKDGIAAPVSGEWDGELYESDGSDNSLPFVAVGHFYSEYHNDGRMVGAFGANKQSSSSTE